jgi:hypothetical protein
VWPGLVLVRRAVPAALSCPHRGTGGPRERLNPADRAVLERVAGFVAIGLVVDRLDLTRALASTRAVSGSPAPRRASSSIARRSAGEECSSTSSASPTVPTPSAASAITIWRAVARASSVGKLRAASSAVDNGAVMSPWWGRWISWLIAAPAVRRSPRPGCG